MQTIQIYVKQFQSDTDLLGKAFLSSSDIEEDIHIMIYSNTSLRNNVRMIVSYLDQLVKYYTYSYTLRD